MFYDHSDRLPLNSYVHDKTSIDYTIHDFTDYWKLGYWSIVNKVIRSRDDFFRIGLIIDYFRDLAMIPSLSDSEIKFEIVIESKNTTFLKTTKGRGSIRDIE